MVIGDICLKRCHCYNPDCRADKAVYFVAGKGYEHMPNMKQIARMAMCRWALFPMF